MLKEVCYHEDEPNGRSTESINNWKKQKALKKKTTQSTRLNVFKRLLIV